MELIRCTRLPAKWLVQLDARTGLETLLVVVKGTFEAKDGEAVLSEVQRPIQLADEYLGEPGQSSLAAAGDLAPFKPRADVILHGNAHTQRGSRTAVLVAFRVGPLQKAARVTGDRVWERGFLGAGPSLPKPFETLPLTHERAYGGTVKGKRCEENPVGVGLLGAGDRVEGSPLPNLESPLHPLQSPKDVVPSVGLGPVAPDWLPRRAFTGTLDQRWQRETFPLLPADFDERFHQVAPADQVFPGYLRGGEPVRVSGATPEGLWDLKLPRVQPEIVIRLGAATERPECACDTLVIDAEAKEVVLTWRARLIVQGALHRLSWIKVQERANAV